MKNKYQRLNKEDRKKARDRFYRTPFGKELKPRLQRILIIGILLLIYASYLLIDAILKKSIWGALAATAIYLFALFFLIGRHKIIVRDVNDFLIKRK